MWMAGNKNKWAWAIALGNQFAWIAFIFMFAAWGLLPLSLGLIFISYRNLVKWNREETNEDEGISTNNT